MKITGFYRHILALTALAAIETLSSGSLASAATPADTIGQSQVQRACTRALEIGTPASLNELLSRYPEAAEICGITASTASANESDSDAGHGDVTRNTAAA